MISSRDARSASSIAARYLPGLNCWSVEAIARFPKIGGSFQLDIDQASASGRHPCAADGAGMAAQLGDRDIIDGDAHIVNPGTSGSRNFPCRRYQPIAELARPDKGDVALRRDRALIVRIVGKGECRVGQRENEAAMG